MKPLITIADLRSQTVKDLSSLARKMGLTGVHAMTKDQLVRALVKASKVKAAAATRRACGGGKPTAKKKRAGCPGEHVGAQPRDACARCRRSPSRWPPRRRRPTRACCARSRRSTRCASSARTCRTPPRCRPTTDRKPKKLAATHPDADTAARTEWCLLVRDPYWLQACWDVTRQSVARARAALAEHWHTCEPTLRLMQVDAGATTATAESMVRDIPIHGGVKNWYIDIKESPNSYRVDLGYLAENGRFYALARSNVVTTPRPGSSDAIDENWTDIAENYEKIYALSGGYEETSAGGDLQELFEERLRRPMGTPLVARCGGSGEQILRRDKDFDFTVDAEMIIYGKTKAGSHVTLAGEPVKLRSDGTFTVRMSMPDRRQLLPVVANSRDGAEQRTIVLAVERNTKIMEPMIREAHS